MKFFGILLIFLGAVIGIPQLVRMLSLRRRCTVQVNAVCVELYTTHHTTHSINTSKRSKTESYFPVWEYTYGDVTYQVRDNYGSGDSDKLLGQPIVLRIDPDSPEDFCRASGDPAAVPVILGAAFLLLGVYLLLRYVI
ncbi:MAG: hypothetical protein IJ055_00475 [Oscillospiraceae bacterium]|nr:hypothetical protein [Oscillospiraceae bacterium]